jgi:hypothetical protein
MGLIKEPLEVDFEFDPKPLTKEEKEKISNYIKAYKAKQERKSKRTKRKRSLSLLKKTVS